MLCCSMSVVRHQLVPSPSTSVKESREKPTTSNGDHTKSEVLTTSHPLISDGKNISDPQIVNKWTNEFLPRPEPPRFFRPLCNRLARQNQILQELEQKHHENTKKIIAEAKRRMEMSIRQTRDEQKVQLKEKRKKIDKNVNKSSFPLEKMSTSVNQQNSNNKRSSSQLNSGHDVKKSRKDLMLTKNGIPAKLNKFKA